MTKLSEKIKSHIEEIATMAAKQGYYSDAESQETTDAIMALIKPKELVWEGDGHVANGPDEGWIEEANPYGDIWYSIEFGHSWAGNFKFVSSIGASKDGFKTPDDAKAAAQEHYNRMWLDMMGGE